MFVIQNNCINPINRNRPCTGALSARSPANNLGCSSSAEKHARAGGGGRGVAGEAASDVAQSKCTICRHIHSQYQYPVTVWGSANLRRNTLRNFHRSTISYVSLECVCVFDYIDRPVAAAATILAKVNGDGDVLLMHKLYRRVPEPIIVCATAASKVCVSMRCGFDAITSVSGS